MSEEVITQVRSAGLNDELSAELPEIIALDLRGTKFEISKDLLLTLPENILFGLSMSTPLPHIEADGTVRSSDNDDDGTMRVDFSPKCFEYIVSMISSKNEGLVPVPVMNFKAAHYTGSQYTPTEDSEELFEDDGLDNLPWLPLSPSEVPTVLASRPAFIMLREDLEYYVFNKIDISDADLNNLKDQVGIMLADGDKNRYIFAGLRNSTTLNSPEYHLMQMLVLSGFSPEELWAFRERMPNSSRVLSLQLTEVQIPDPEMLESIYALQKLLLFWRKPAKKCWWERFELTIDEKPIVVHARRVWTLELDILGLELAA